MSTAAIWHVGMGVLAHLHADAGTDMRGQHSGAGVARWSRHGGTGTVAHWHVGVGTVSWWHAVTGTVMQSGAGIAR